MHYKKGQTLVEVIVALGILAFVFAGTVTLIVQVVNLELAARNRTEAVALAQKYMALNIQSMGNGCTNLGVEQDKDQGQIPHEKYNIDSIFTYYDSNLANEVALLSASFVKIDVKIDWINKGNNPEDYTLTQFERVRQ